jgi:D-alanyl-D-alanine carboxypeptidase
MIMTQFLRNFLAGMLPVFLFVQGIAHAQNFNPTLAAQLQQKIDSIRTASNLKGISAGVFVPGAGTWKGVSGISHPGTPINSEMEFAIASNTKLFTGVLMLKLAENNLIHLDDSLHEYLPHFNNIDSNITIRQLLHQTSGLADVTSVPGYPDSMLSNPNRIFTAAELMTWAGPPLFPPGTGWNYCNTNYLLSGMIAEAVTGRSYSQLLRDSILNPLQLDSTFLDVYETIPFPVAQPWQAGTNNHSIPRKSVNSAAWAAGAMYSTSGEMLQWYRALMGGQVLKPESFQEMTTFVGSGKYGVGISRATVNGRTVWQHGGTIWGGYNSSMMYDTASGIIVCVLINQLPAQAYQVSARLLSVLTSQITSITEAEKEAAMVLIPNPANQCISISELKNPQPYTILQTTGKELQTGMTSGEMDVSSLSAGMYLLRLGGGAEVKTFRFLKN